MIDPEEYQKQFEEDFRKMAEEARLERMNNPEKIEEEKPAFERNPPHLTGKWSREELEENVRFYKEMWEINKAKKASCYREHYLLWKQEQGIVRWLNVYERELIRMDEEGEE